MNLAFVCANFPHAPNTSGATHHLVVLPLIAQGTIVGFALAALMLSNAPVALADETQPDCEQDQPWAGYQPTRPLQEAYERDLGDPGHVDVCEGEHWDGQDSVQDDQGGETGTFRADPNDFFWGSCSEPQPQSGGLACIPLRVSSTDTQRVHVGAGYWAVGTFAIYADDERTSAYYAVSEAAISRKDCTYVEYLEDEPSGINTRCGINNDAVTVEHALAGEVLCGPAQNPNRHWDGDCDGSDWQPPTEAGLVDDALSFTR